MSFIVRIHGFLRVHCVGGEKRNGKSRARGRDGARVWVYGGWLFARLDFCYCETCIIVAFVCSLLLLAQKRIGFDQLIMTYPETKVTLFHDQSDSLLAASNVRQNCLRDVR